MPKAEGTTDHGDALYYIIFGADICGYDKKKIHMILNDNGKNLLVKDFRCKDDEYNHSYTLAVKPDSTYDVFIDHEKAQSGTLEDWDFLRPKKIKDPAAKKPADWDDREYIDDPDDKNWEQPDHIADPDAKKPEDWDDEMNGEWEPPLIINPKYKGEWKPRRIKNPNYKGEWVHPEIPNPEYTPAPRIYHYKNIDAVGFDLWQLKSSDTCDYILVIDSDSDVEFEDETRDTATDAEEKVKENVDEEAKKKWKEEDARKQDEL